jgi:hypothetical protein
MALSFEQQLWIELAREMYGLRGEGFREDWSFHLHAGHFELGAPLARSLPGSEALVVGNDRYIVQPFARDVLFYQFPQYAQIRQLSAVLPNLSPATPTSSLPYKVLNTAFRRSIQATPGFTAGTRTLRPEWTFHQLAVERQLGMALSPNYTTRQGRIALQIFAGDTLFSRTSPFNDAEFLSELPTSDELAATLWNQTYRISGAVYNPDSPFHQEGTRLRLGAPLSGVYQIYFEGVPITLQIFAYDILYAFTSGPILRWSDLPKPDSVANYRPPAPIVTPDDHFVPGTRLRSLWLDANPNAPANIRAMIETSLKMLGRDSEVFPRLTPQQQAQMQGSTDIVCADLIAIAYREAGLTLNWAVTIPQGTIFTGNRAANYYRPHPGRFVELAPGTNLEPGDLFIYKDPRFTPPANWRAGEYHHVLIYVGHFAGEDASGRPFDQNKNYCVVSSSIGSEWIHGYDEARARDATIFGYNTVQIVRPTLL